MQSIDKALLKRLEELSMLKIEEEHSDTILKELNNFLSFVDILDELPLENIEATFNPLNSAAPLRKDIPNPQPEVGQKILAIAPKAEDDFFIVPKIIE